MARAPVPLTVVGGFLGSGKTTLLNRWLGQADGQRLAVLVNDFGALNIDAQLVAASAGGVIALTNGCVCCQIGDDLGAALIAVLDGPAPVDAIVIEASGVSDPARIGRYGRVTPDLLLDGVIVLVDSAAFATQAADPLLADTLQRQVAGADLLVLNKLDLATPVQIEAARARLRTWAPGVPSLATSQAQVPLPLLTSLAKLPHGPGLQGARSRPPAAGAGRSMAPSSMPAPPEASPRIGRPGVLNPDPSHGTVFDTWSCPAHDRFSTEALRALLRSMPAGVLRAKGVVRSETGELMELQYASGRGRLQAAPAGTAQAHGVVVIGLAGGVPRAELEAAFAAAARPP